MTSLATKTYITFFLRLIEIPEWNEEICYIRNLLEQGTGSLTVDTFFRQYCYVVLCSYWKEQYARKEWERFFETGDLNAISNRRKRAAIAFALDHVQGWYEELMKRNKDEYKLAFIRTLPFMKGEALGYHLARNIGLDYVKPDRHLKRFAEQFGFRTPLELCQHVSDEIGGSEKIGLIDLVFWRASNLGWG